jgi:hypothetical protein
MAPILALGGTVRRNRAKVSRTLNARRLIMPRSEHFDCFPMTQHVECVCVLVRASWGPMVAHGGHQGARGDTVGAERITHVQRTTHDLATHDGSPLAWCRDTRHDEDVTEGKPKGCNICGMVPVVARGWCRKHYSRWYRNGDPQRAKYDRTDGPPLDRWLARVEKTESCWLWRGELDRDQYGTFGVHGADSEAPGNYRAHRWGYEHLVRALGEDEVLARLCPNRSCVNPAHLEPTSRAVVAARTEHANSKKTHCAQGHPFNEANTAYLERGSRRCRACDRIAARKRRTGADGAQRQQSRAVVLEDVIDRALRHLSDPDSQADPNLPQRLREILTDAV